MPKYVYTPITQLAFDQYLEVSGNVAGDEERWANGLPAELHVTVETPEDSDAVRKYITWIPGWELLRVEE